MDVDNDEFGVEDNEQGKYFVENQGYRVLADFREEMDEILAGQMEYGRARKFLEKGDQLILDLEEQADIPAEREIYSKAAIGLYRLAAEEVGVQEEYERTLEKAWKGILGGIQAEKVNEDKESIGPEKIDKIVNNLPAD